MYRPVRNMFIGVVVKIVMNLVLILPFHIIGAAIATTLGYLVSTSLNASAVRKYSNVHFSVWKLSAPLILASIVCSVGLFIGDKVGLALAGDFTSPDVKALIEVISGIAVGGVVPRVNPVVLRCVPVRAAAYPVRRPSAVTVGAEDSSGVVLFKAQDKPRLQNHECSNARYAKEAGGQSGDGIKREMKLKYSPIQLTASTNRHPRTALFAR